MRTIDMTVPELALLAATRGMAGAGIGLLAGEFLSRDSRRTLGWTLLAIGALSTVPLALQIFGKRQGSTAVGQEHSFPRSQRFRAEQSQPVAAY